MRYFLSFVSSSWSNGLAAGSVACDCDTPCTCMFPETFFLNNDHMGVEIDNYRYTPII